MHADVLGDVKVLLQINDDSCMFIDLQEQQGTDHSVAK